MPRPCRVCVVGSANVDLTFRISRLPQPGETLAGHALHTGLGGKGANQAVAAARLGAEVAFVACVGDDAFGAEAIDRYQAEGIDTTFVRRVAKQPTGAAAILVDDAAENCIIVVAGANAELSAADVRRAASVIEQADIVLCQLETPLEGTLEAFCLARAAGKRTVLTPAPAAPLSDELLGLCDLCVPNRTEAEVLAGRPIYGIEDARRAAEALRARGVGSAVVTLGASGAVLVDDAGSWHVPAIQVEAVDATGAGDAFTAALAVSLAEGLNLEEAGRRASVAAAISVMRIGAQSSFPDRREVSERMP